MSKFHDLQISKMAEHDARQIISNPLSYTPNERMIACHTADNFYDDFASPEVEPIELDEYGEY